MKDNIQAFPLLDDKFDTIQEGMTLLDYFAAKAMQAMLIHVSVNSGQFDQNSVYAQLAYRQASSMLEERKKYIES